MAHGCNDEESGNGLILGRELDLLAKYPKTKRNLSQREIDKSEETRAIAREFGPEFFDGDRKYGYGGLTYNAKYWSHVVHDIEAHYGPLEKSSLLDVGCAKGFMLYDIKRAFPETNLQGVDVSEYAISHSHPEIKQFLRVADARELPFNDDSFDVVISINTIHNLNYGDCMLALSEIQRVSRKHSFVMVDAYANEEEKNRMLAWNLTAKTILSEEGWKKMFDDSGYNGDYYWFKP